MLNIFKQNKMDQWKKYFDQLCRQLIPLF